MVCKKCGQQFEDGFNKCPNCGESVNGKKKAKKPVFKKWWFWVIVVVFVVGILGSSGGSDETESTTTKKSETETVQVQNTEEIATDEIPTEEITVEETTTEIADYREICVSVGYKDIARMPDDYDGKDVYFTGEVVQVMESSFTSSVTYRINVTKDEYGFWEDTVYVTYKLPDGAPRILENDIVDFYGVCKGTYTYSSVLGSNITIPYVDAKIIDIVS